MITILRWNEMELLKKKFVLKQSINNFKLAEQQVKETQLSRKQLKNRAKKEFEKTRLEMIKAKKDYNETLFQFNMLKISL